MSYRRHVRRPHHRWGPLSRHRPAERRAPLITILVLSLAVAGSTAVTALAESPEPQAVAFEVQSLNGSGNNQANPGWGEVGNEYSRVAPTNYADGLSEPVAGPNSRYISNRVFNDVHQNLFSESQVTQWGFTWGQFLDHTFGLRLGAEPIDPPGEQADIPFDSADPLEEFTNDLGVIPFTRSTAAPDTGETTPREQVNTVSSYIDAWAVYGGTEERLEWMREGPVDGDLSNNSAYLLMPDQYLPRGDARGDPDAAPFMETGGRLQGQQEQAAVAGDVRANENLALTATHTLFAREHNRIVSQLPDTLSDEDKFQIARRVVIAEQQYITYTEFLPAMGISLPAYTGYDPSINTDLSNEFATVGYRAHSMIHGEIELETEADRYTPAELDAFEDMGLEVTVEGDEVEIAVPLNLAFFNPDLVESLQLGALLQGIGLEAQYKNEEQIDNQLRSVLFQIPVSGNPECLDGPGLPECFDGVVDLGAIDVQRGRDHGMPSYNDLRAAYGLGPFASFTDITGEDTDELPPGIGIDDPSGLEFTDLVDVFGVSFPAEEDRDPTEFTRGSTLAARLAAIYGSVDELDAFTGMLAEPHLDGSQFGELQQAIWTREFQRLRDGDRFFYGGDPGLSMIKQLYGIDYRNNLGDIIARNTDISRSELGGNVFFVDGHVPPASCQVHYVINGQWGDGSGGFNTTIRITNTGTTPIPSGWTLRFVFANGQEIYDLWNGEVEQDGSRVPITNAHWNATIDPGQTVDGVGFNATWTGTNERPTAISVNTTACSVT